MYKAFAIQFWENVEKIKSELYCANIETTLMDETS